MKTEELAQSQDLHCEKERIGILDRYEEPFLTSLNK